MDNKQRVLYTSSVDGELIAGIRKLSEITRVPQSRLMDEAINDLLRKYGDIIKDHMLKESTSYLDE